MGEIRFAQSARRHRIGRARALHVLANPIAIATCTPDPDGRVLFVGDDHTGRPLDVIGIVIDANVLLVIHVMDLRPKYRPLYEGVAR